MKSWLNTKGSETSKTEGMVNEKKTYCFVFELAIDYYLYASFGFLEQSENMFIPLVDAEKLFPEFYNIWLKRIRALNLPKLKQSTYTSWYYIENTVKKEKKRLEMCDET